MSIEPMIIWVDADACPQQIKTIICRAAMRRSIRTVFVANHAITLPASTFIRAIQVPLGLDKADAYIVQKLKKNDLIITADILLADSAVTKGGTALNPRGQLYTPYTIKQALSARNFNQSLRDAGMTTGGPASLNAQHIKLFSQHLDTILTANKF